jgi:ribosomal protein S27AE
LKNGASVSNLINLTCPSCGGKLQITNDIERFSCGFCGNEQIVQRIGGIITLAPVVEGLKGVKTGVDKTASELAIVRLKGEILALSEQRGKTVASPSLTILVLFGILFAISYCALSYVTESTAFVLLGSLLISGIIVVISYSKIEQNMRLKAEPFDKTIAEKVQELNKHQNIIADKTFESDEATKEETDEEGILEETIAIPVKLPTEPVPVPDKYSNSTIVVLLVIIVAVLAVVAFQFSLIFPAVFGGGTDEKGEPTLISSSEEKAWSSCAYFIEKQMGVSLFDSPKYFQAKVKNLGEGMYSAEMYYAKQQTTFECVMQELANGDAKLINLDTR